MEFGSTNGRGDDGIDVYRLSLSEETGDLLDFVDPEYVDVHVLLGAGGFYEGGEHAQLVLLAVAGVVEAHPACPGALSRADVRGYALAQLYH